jgi:hypothetical protein
MEAKECESSNSYATFVGIPLPPFLCQPLQFRAALAGASLICRPDMGPKPHPQPLSLVRFRTRNSALTLYPSPPRRGKNPAGPLTLDPSPIGWARGSRWARVTSVSRLNLTPKLSIRGCRRRNPAEAALRCAVRWPRLAEKLRD